MLLLLIRESFVNNWGEHLSIFLAGSTALGLVAHAVNTFPTPSNPYGQWLLGIIKFAVGQRQSAMNAMRGNDTAVVAVPQGTGSSVTAALQGTGSSSTAVSTITDVTPDTIKIATEKVVKSEVSVPVKDAGKDS